MLRVARRSAVVAVLAVALAAGCASHPDAAGGAPSPVEAAPRPTALLSAHGNEPSWALVGDADRLELVLLDGERVVIASPVGERVPGGERWRGRSGDAELRVDVARRLCRDTMSGMSYPDAVAVTWRGRTLTGCGGDPAALLAGAWVVTDVAGAPPAPGSTLTLEFLPDGRVVGAAPCNQLTATVQLTGEGLAFGALATTRKACTPSLMDDEARYLDALRAVARHELDDRGGLVLVGPGNARIRARRP